MRGLDKDTKVVILAGGFGTRISEESLTKPKPMIEIGEKPILWHIMRIYAYYGFTNFIICLGYKGYSIKEYFYHYFLHHSDVTIDLSNQSNMTIHESVVEPWKITLVDTGKETMTGGRLKRVQKYIGNKTFMLTYGDGVSDVDISMLAEFHFAHGKLATVTAAQPSGRFGALELDNSGQVIDFLEKPKGDGSWINSGFFIMEPQLLDYIEGDQTSLETDCMQKIARDGELMAYQHTGFFQPMDTLKDKHVLDELWRSGKALWKK